MTEYNEELYFRALLKLLALLCKKKKWKKSKKEKKEKELRNSTVCSYAK